MEKHFIQQTANNTRKILTKYRFRSPHLTHW